MTTEQFQQALLAWFDRHGRRHLPWQENPTPYRVWISEIMLQQTQVATVIPYFQRFMERFPELPDLAAADPSQVLEYWAGLGYYARGRNLHRAAQAVVQHHGGQLPADADLLVALPGIGRSTAGAILSMAFGIRAPILDGNVRRVLCRHRGIEGWPGEAAVLRQLWEIADHFTPNQRVGAYTQAIMDLGATLCTPRSPACPRCPLQTGCLAHQTGRVESLPASRPRKALPVKSVLMLALRDDAGAFYLQQRPPTGIWGGLWSLPEFAGRDELDQWCRSRGIEPASLEPLPRRRHTFSHYHLDYTPVVGIASCWSRIEDVRLGEWRRADRQTALPSPVRRLLEQLQHPTDTRGSP